MESVMLLLGAISAVWGIIFSIVLFLAVLRVFSIDATLKRIAFQLQKQNMLAERRAKEPVLNVHH
jgi:hypothetical protein